MNIACRKAVVLWLFLQVGGTTSALGSNELRLWFARSLTGIWDKCQWTLHHVLHSYCCHRKVLNNDKIRNSMPGHAATLRRRIYVCKLYHTDPRRLLLLKQILRRLRIPIFSAQFILILLELMFQLCSLLCLSFQTAHENNFTDFLSSVNCPKEHLLPSQPHPAAHTAPKACCSLAVAKK